MSVVQTQAKKPRGRKRLAETAVMPTGRRPARATRGVPIIPAATERFHYSEGGYPPASNADRARNLKELGYECPRDHYIFGPAEVTAYSIAKQWGCNAKGVELWIKKYNWKDAKRLHLESLPDVQGGLMPTENLAVLQEMWLKEQIEIADEQIALARADLQLQTEEKMSATGCVQEMKRTAASKRLDQQRLFDAMDRKSIALRMPHKMTGAFAGANIDNRKQTMNYAVFMPGAEPPCPALPSPAPPDDAIEGEVSES